MIHIISATTAHIPVIQDIAYRTWPETFADILSSEQIDYMLDMMYSDAALNRQLQELGHAFLLAKSNKTDSFLGYISYESPYQGMAQTKIHKIYISPDAQGLGVGKALMEAVENGARARGDHWMMLNVNKYNKAEAFYQKLGFEVVGTEDIDIGSGFLMEDKVMRKRIMPDKA